jgi:hypothetical protein
MHVQNIEVRNLEVMYATTPVYGTGTKLSLESTGVFWFGSNSSSAKKWAAHQVLAIIWFVAKILAANGCPPLPLTDSCKIVGQMRAKDSLTKKMASQLLPNIW